MTDVSASVTSGRVFGESIVILNCPSSDPLARVTVRANTTACCEGSRDTNVASIKIPECDFDTLKDNAASVCYAVLTVEDTDSTKVTGFDFALRY